MKPLLILVTILTFAFSSKNQQNNSDNFNQNVMHSEKDKKAIETLLFSYRDALNTSDVKKVFPLYSSDGVFMPSGGPSAIGLDQVKSSYEFVFKTIQLNIEFFIDEIVIDGNYAFARTTSKGTTLLHASGATIPEENRELFVLQKVEGQWKIARYMFNKMK